jgi:hypothetical protein
VQFIGVKMSSSTLSNSHLVQISEIAGIGEARSQAKIVTGKLADSFADDQKIQKKHSNLLSDS